MSFVSIVFGRILVGGVGCGGEWSGIHSILRCYEFGSETSLVPTMTLAEQTSLTPTGAENVLHSKSLSLSLR